VCGYRSVTAWLTCALRIIDIAQLARHFADAAALRATRGRLERTEAAIPEVGGSKPDARQNGVTASDRLCWWR
jgi:hypothetical protein